MRANERIFSTDPFPAQQKREVLPDLNIESFMFEPMSRPGSNGYVPLCSALHWIATDRGTKIVGLNENEPWQSSVNELLPLLSDGAVEIIGRRRGMDRTETIAGCALSLLQIVAPAADLSGNDCLMSADAHISCSTFIEPDFWRSYSDELYEPCALWPVWSHLQVRKSQILARWPRPRASEMAGRDCFSWLVEQMRTHSIRPKPKSEFREEAKELFRPLSDRKFNYAWATAIASAGAHSWAEPGRPKKSNHFTS